MSNRQPRDGHVTIGAIRAVHLRLTPEQHAAISAWHAAVCSDTAAAPPPQIALLQAHLAELARVLTDVVHHAAPLLEHLAALNHHTNQNPREEEPPTDLRARALWLRKRRNTGPRPHRRAPHRIDAHTNHHSARPRRAGWSQRGRSRH